MTEWHYEHSDHDCQKCKKGSAIHALNFYLGEIDGEEAHKYECSNVKCDFVEIKTLEQLMKEARV